jgi:hypothetical protein
MRRLHLALGAAGALLLSLGVSAEAAGRGGGGPHGAVAPFTPPGLSTTNQGFANPNSNKSTALPNSTPSGWTQGTQGNARAPDPWKGVSAPPGLTR